MSDPSESFAQLSPLKRALVALTEMRSRIAELEGSKTEPIAVVGLGCRFPAGATDPQGFWRLLRDGVDAITEVPPDRWNVDAFYNPDPEAPGKMYTRYGAFLKEVDKFDAQFFGIAPREAMQIDPQQRLVLEVSWEALESAGQSPAMLAGSQTGAFIGVMTNDYAQAGSNPLIIDAYTGTGMADCFAAGRLSYTLGLQGPSMTVETACSSSLVAVHLACQSLRSRECNLALAGGVNLILSPGMYIITSKLQAMARDGRCKTFDAAADGYGRGEGCGIVVLKRLSDAISNRDNILALIRGSAVNHDGSSGGLTVPNGLAQKALIRHALECAAIKPEQVAYVEAHGTGTSLGDPIEVRALAEVLCEERAIDQSLAIGSVKTNIGHLEGAAGIAGFIKVVLALQNREIPPHLHLKKPNPYVPWNELPVLIPTERTPWRSENGPRIAGVSSFGISGTNAHVVVEEAPEQAYRTASGSDRVALQADFERPIHLLSLSAKTSNALKQLAARFECHFAAHPNDALPDVCFTANTGRSHFPHRLAIVAKTSDQARQQLADFASQHQVATAPCSVGANEHSGSSHSPKVAFLFTGQESQYAGMGRRLFETQPTFRHALQQCLSIVYPDRALDLLPWTTDLGARTVFAIEYALAQLWLSWGIEPAAVMGHGVGEYVAACVAGVLTLEGALKLIAGGDAPPGRLYNLAGPAASSGHGDVLSEGRDAPVGRLPEIPMISSAGGVQSLFEQGYTAVVELGPPTIPQGAGLLLPSLSKERGDWQQILESLAALYVHGVKVDWSGFDRDYPRRRLPLPTYPFQRERYWMEMPKEPITSAAASNGSATGAFHALLGRRLRSPLFKEILFESHISTESLPFLNDHQIHGMVVFPTTAYLEMALGATQQAYATEFPLLEDVLIHEPLVLSEGETQNVQLILTGENSGKTSFQILSLNAGEVENDKQTQWKLHATGRLNINADLTPLAREDFSFEKIRTRCRDEVPVEYYYERLKKRGLEYGASFRGIENLWRRNGEAVGRIRISEDSGFRIHPALFDACLQVFGAALSDEESEDMYLPVGLERFRILGSPSGKIWSWASIDNQDKETVTGNLRLFDAAGRILAELDGFRLKRANREQLSRVIWRGLTDWLYEIEWQPKTTSSAEHTLPGRWVIFADRAGVGKGLALLLEKRGDSCVLVFPGDTSNSQGEGHLSIDPTRPEEFERLFRNLFVSDRTPCRGVAHLWSLDAGSPSETTIAAIQTAQTPGCRSVLHLTQGLVKAGVSAPPRLWLITRGAQVVGNQVSARLAQSPVWGLGRVIALEHPEFQCSQIDLDPAAGPDEIQSLMEVIGSQDREDQIALRGGVCHVARLVHRTSRAVEEVTPSRAAERQSFELVIPTRGELNNLTLRPATRQTPARGAVEIQVFATGLNFRDVLNALGLYPGDPGPLGAECSGTITALGEGVEGLEIGNEVVALASGSFSSFVTTNAALVAPKPSSLSFEEAATIPLAFLTAYYALHHVAKVSAGDRVLIHAAAGGVGLAAVQLAHRAGAIVFGTASQSKWSFLQSLGVQHVMNSRTLDFRKEVMEHTGGRGVDIVLSSLAGEFIPASLSVLKEGGQFLELGKTGIWEKGRVAEFRNNISYSAIALDHVCAEDPALVGLMLRELMQAFQNGALKPLPKQVFPIQEVVQAFRHMAQAKHIGKIVVSQPDSIAATVRERHKPIRPDSTYLITGGLGALGFQVARWMVQKGARHLVLLARRGPSDSIRERIKELELAGAKVVVAQGDVSQERDVARVLATIADSMHPLRGIIHAAGVLDDGMLLHQDWSRFARVMAPKVEGSWNLHEQTRELPLDFFVCFSSAASILGSPGQGNYAAANAFIDTLAHARRMAGLPGLSIGWGPWSEAGMAAALGNRAEWQRTGVGIIAPEQGLHILEDLLQQTSGRVAVLPVNWSKFVHRFPAGQIPSLLSGIAHEMSARVLSSEQLPERSDILLRLEETPANRRRHLLEAHIRDHVTKVLGLDPSKPLNVKEPLKELGLDSLMAIELRNALGASLGRTLPATMLFDHPAIESLVRYLAGDVLNLKTGEESQPEAAEDEKQQVEVVAKLEQLSEDQAEALLIKKLGNASF